MNDCQVQQIIFYQGTRSGPRRSMKTCTYTLGSGYTWGSTDEKLKIGDMIEFLCNGSGRGGHYRVKAMVTKVNRKTVAATEALGSYKPGTLWIVSLDKDLTLMLDL